MALTAVQIRAFVAGESSYRKTDEKGLYLEVFPNGSKLWRFKYRMNGKEKRLALGAWPDVSLADARQKRDEARKAIQSGSDPLHNRKMEKIAGKVSAGNSFASVAEEFIQVEFVNDGKAERTIGKARWFISLLAPAIGARPISEIEPAELLLALRKLEAKGHRVPTAGIGSGLLTK